MPQLPAHEVYRTHMADAKLRILAAERALESALPVTGHASLDIEFCFLQIRRVIEAITFGGMVRDEARYSELRKRQGTVNSKDHGVAARDWQAPEILKRLVSLSPHALPIPHLPGRQVSPGLTHFERQKIDVSHARLIDLYERSGGFLHAKNPVGRNFAALVDTERKRYKAAPKDVRRALSFLRKLLWQHVVVNLEPAADGDPMTPGAMASAWIISFGQSQDHQVEITVAQAV